jgi:hypothetical protein
MIAVMLRAWLAVAALAAGLPGCSKPPPEALQLDGNRLVVFNASPEDWTDVEIWLNRQFRVPVPRIEAGGRFLVPLDLFTAGYGQRFDFRRTQIRDLRLKARRPDGEPFEMQYEFRRDGLDGVLSRFKGQS